MGTVEWDISKAEGQTAIFSGNQYYVVLCWYCDGTHHPEQCPRVEEIEYYPDHSIKRVKLRKPKQCVTGGFPRTTVG